MEYSIKKIINKAKRKTYQSNQINLLEIQQSFEHNY